MYDTLGFPIDLTQIMASENDYKVDIEGFQNFMIQQKERSRIATKTKRLAGRNDLSLGVEQISNLQKSNVPLTDDSSKYKWDHVLPTTLVGIVDVEKGLIDDSVNLKSSDTIGIILKSTSFYPEAGGQVPDSGIITLVLDNDIQVELDVLDVQVYGGFVLHTCVLSDEYSSNNYVIKIGNKAFAKVDYSRRRKVAPNHTMTHVLNFALRKIIKDGNIDQKGSLVSEEKFRFDFSLNRAVSIDELDSVESIVNKVIKDELEVNNQVVPLANALKINGLRAVFGEVYPDPVRVISVGPKIDKLIETPDKHDWVDYSVEFCGGTHLSNTKDAKAFVILEETAVAKGIRRVSGVTGSDAIEAIERAISLDKELNDVVSQLKHSKDSIVGEELSQLESKVIELRQRLDNSVVSQVFKSKSRNIIEGLQKDIAILKNKEMMIIVDRAIVNVLKEIETIQNNGMTTAVIRIDIGSDAKAIKRVIEEIKKVFFLFIVIILTLSNIVYYSIESTSTIISLYKC